MTQEFRLYRHDNEDGTAKEWAVAYTGAGKAVTCWGKAGHLSNVLVVSSAIAMKREHDKERKGYRYVGQIHWVGDGGQYVRLPSKGKTAAARIPPRLPPAVPKADPIDIKALLGGDDDGFYF
jgi:hypothetical protein